MSTLANPGTMKATFSTWTEASASTVLAVINRIFVGPLCYVSDGAGTALSTNGGTRLWSPAPGATATLAHWNVSGSAHNASSATRYMTTPSANEAGRIQQAFDWAVSRGAAIMGDPERVYGTRSQLVFGARSGGPSVKDGAMLSDFNLMVIGGTWATGDQSAVDEDEHTYGPAALVIGKALSAGGAGKIAVDAFRLRIDANRIAPVATLVMGVSRSLLCRVHSERGIDADTVAGYPLDVTGSDSIDSWTNTSTVFLACTGTSFKFEERSDGTIGSDDGSGWWGLTGRTSHGLVVRGSDMRFVSCEFWTGKQCLTLGRGFDNQFTGGKFWMGVPEDDTNSRVAVIGKRAERYRITSVTFQDGHLYIKGLDGQFVGCTFDKFTFNQIRLVATEAGETGARFLFNSNDCHDDNALMVEEGSGTWGTFAGAIGTNHRLEGASFSIQGAGMQNGFMRYRVTGHLRLGVVDDTALVANLVTGEIAIGDDGGLYYHDGVNKRKLTGTPV